MSDSITARTMFCDNRNGQIRFHDWCKVSTTLGTMMEPRQLIQFRNGSKDNRSTQLNPNDQCAKVTNLEFVDLRGVDVLLSDKKKVTIKGNQMPRDFSF